MHDDLDPHVSQPGAAVAWAALLARHRRLVVGLPLAVTVATGAYALLRPREYTAMASFTPRASDLPKGALGGLAAQLGVNVTGDPSQSPDFYADLIRSRPILRAVVETTYTLPPGGALPSGSGVALVDARGTTPARRLDDAMKRLSDRVTVTKNTKTGVVQFTVTMRSAELSAAMAARVLDQLDRFNLETRRRKAADEERYMELRLRDLRSQLDRAEDVLADFRARNRETRFAPELQKTEQRLERDATMRQQVFSSVAQLYEQARLEALRDVPVITVVEAPLPPPKPDSRRVALKCALALLLTGGLSVLAAAVGESFRRDIMPQLRDAAHSPPAETRASATPSAG